MKKTNLIYRLFIFSIVCLIFAGCAETNKDSKVFATRGTYAGHAFESIRACIEERQAYRNCIESGGKRCFRTYC